MTNSTLTVLILLAAAVALPGCEKKKETGVARMPGLPDSTQVSPGAVPPVGDPADAEKIPTHTAPPLSQLASGAGHGAGMTSGTMDTAHAGAADANMEVQAGETRVLAGGNILQVAGLAFTVSDAWENVKPNNPVRVAEYKLNGAGGPAEMAIFYFGKNQGGGVEDNIRRWAAQFSDGSTTASGAEVGRIEKGGLKIALVKTDGTYNPGSMGPMMPKVEPKPDFALFGLVVEGGPEGSVFVKVTGPKATIAEQNEALETMAQSVRISEFK